MKQSKFPEGWNEARVSELLAVYEAQTEEEAVAEDEAGVESVETVMSVPYELVPQSFRAVIHAPAGEWRSFLVNCVFTYSLPGTSNVELACSRERS